jgi:hypothetical protein
LYLIESLAQRRYIKTEKDREEWEMKNNPEGEIEEMIELYMGKEFTREDATVIITTMAKNNKFFVDHMMVYGCTSLSSIPIP